LRARDILWNRGDERREFARDPGHDG
jgi:hypothetical protein